MRPSEEYFGDVERRLRKVLDSLAAPFSAQDRADVEYEIAHGEYGEALRVLISIIESKSIQMSRASREELAHLGDLMGISDELPDDSFRG